MFLSIFVLLVVSVCGSDLFEPKFQVLTPDELMVEVPHYEDKKLVTFRIGVRRSDSEAEDLELGENIINNNRIFIYDERLDLKSGDVVNYLLAFSDKEGYQARTGSYIFDGVYFKKPFGRRHRFRRTAPSSTEKSAQFVHEEDAEVLTPVESRFGFHHHQGRHWPHNHGFDIYGPPHQGPAFFIPGQQPGLYPGMQPGPYPGPHPGREDHPHNKPPVFGPNCDDHRHDDCHKNDPMKMEKPRKDCCPCKDEATQMPTTSSTTTTTSTEYPDIDIRFSE